MSNTIRAALLALTCCLLALLSTANGQDQQATNFANVPSWNLFAELAPSQGSNLQFGISSAVSQSAAVVGSIRDSDYTGAAYVFVRSPLAPNTVQQVARLTASDGQPQDFFGSSVSISGNTIVVSAPNVNSGRGKVYVFVEPPTGWTDMTETAQLIASDGEPKDQFGTSVSLSASTAVVGALNHAVNSNLRQGAAYVFIQPQGGWTNMTQTAELTASDGLADSEFAISVAISGNSAAIGTNSWAQGVAPGAVYVFEKPSGGWVNMTQTAELSDPHQIAIGPSVAISDNTIATGSPSGSIGKGPTGAVDVYVKPVGGWRSTKSPAARLGASDGDVGDQLGFSVATTGNTVIAGAPYAHCLGYFCQQGIGDGIVYAFAEPQNGWTSMTQTAELAPSDGMSEGFFGESVGASSIAVIVGASGTDTAYVYKYNSSSSILAAQ